MANKKRIIIGSILLLLFIIDAILIFTGNMSWLDNKAYRFFIAFKNDTLTTVMKCITFLASVKFIIACVVLFLIIILIKKWWKLTPLIISVLVHLPAYSCKYIFRRTRPSESLWLVQEHGYSFPSGHSMIVIFFYGTIIYLMNKYDFKYKKVLTAVFAALIIMVPITRIYLGVHYFSDTIGGLLLASSLLCFLSILYDKKAK